MRAFSSSTAALCLVALLLGSSPSDVFAAPSPVSSSLVVHETASPAALSRWTRVASALSTDRVQLSVALRQPGLGELRKRLDAASDPESATYGAHLSREHVQALQAPADDAVAAVQAWLAGAGISDFSQDGSSAWIRFNATVSQANRLLACDFSRFVDREGGKEALRATTYSLPSGLDEFVDFVFPVTQFINSPTKPAAASELVPPPSSLSRRQDTLPASCNDYTTPDCLSQLYNINYTVPDDKSPVEFGIAGFLEEYPNQSYITTFLNALSPRRNEPGYSGDYKIPTETINPNNAPERPAGQGAEALLDAEYSMAFIQPMNVTFFSTAGRGPDLSGPNHTQVPDSQSAQEPWVELLEHLLARPAVPHVLSISYTDDEQLIPEPYARRVCDLFMQLAARGSSVLVATGDGGAAGIRPDDCTNADKANDPRDRKFLATFPVDCPYVTAVGATGSYAPFEPSRYSSGGFSEFFPRPAWQEAAVAGYVARLNGSHDGWYSPQGRAYPDLSAVGSRFLMQPVVKGVRPWTQTGTSASTPVIASMIALANDRRMRDGHPPLGFLNPLLYSARMAPAFNDVKSGSSGGCLVDGSTIEPGWAALEGWDASTGLGTLDFTRFMQALEGHKG